MRLLEIFYAGLTVLRSKVYKQEESPVFNKYPSYWHMRLFGSSDTWDSNSCYLAARPNPGAGIGHQMANWIAGYYYAKFFSIKFAALPFPSSHVPYSVGSWDEFLGFNENEVSVRQLVSQGYRLVRLPLFHENDAERDVIRKIMSSYQGKRIVFLFEQDQPYQEQYGVMTELRQKFHSAKARKSDRLIFDSSNYNIAVHVRRGDIVQAPGQNNENLTMRWLDTDYYINVLANTVKYIATDRPIHIYLFSQGKKEDFPEFLTFPNMHYCLDMPDKESFAHMCFADALITSRSSFSYKPALLNKGIKICPVDFWHGYPKTSDWILTDRDGSFITELPLS